MLNIEKLSKKFGNFQALTDISMRVSKGTITALLGPNGSGKTTLLKSLIGSVRYDSGYVRLDNLSDVQSHEYKKMMTYMPQLPGFLPHLSARESIDLLIRLRNEPPINKDRLVADLAIGKFWDQPFGTLSGGMKQKINILQGMMFDFEIAFLDEPTSSLDPHVASYLKHWIKDLKTKGKTVLFTSHIMSEVEEMADHMVLLSNGRILIDESPRAFVRERNSNNLEQALLQCWTNND